MSDTIEINVLSRKQVNQIKEIILYGMFNSYENSIPNKTAEQMQTHKDRLRHEYQNNVYTKAVVDSQVSAILNVINSGGNK